MLTDTEMWAIAETMTPTRIQAELSQWQAGAHLRYNGITYFIYDILPNNPDTQVFLLCELPYADDFYELRLDLDLRHTPFVTVNCVTGEAYTNEIDFNGYFWEWEVC